MNGITQLIDKLVDNEVGVLSSVAEMRLAPGAPSFFHYVVHPCSTRAFSEYAIPGPGGAAGADRKSAVTRVVLDGIASYCAALISEEDGKHPIGPAHGAPFPCVVPEDFALFSEEQYTQPDFPWVAFSRHTPVQWSEAVNPVTEASVFIPSAMRFLTAPAVLGFDEAPIMPPTSTGLACHWIAACAATEAICDVIECDALALLWQARLSMPQIRVETLSDANYELVTRFESTGASVTLFKVEFDLGIPSILAVLSDSRPGAPARTFAAGTSLTPENGVRKSLEMLAHVHQYCQLLRAQDCGYRDPQSVRDQSEHLRFWSDPRNSAQADFVFSSRERIEFDQLEDLSTGYPGRDLQKLLNNIEAAGYYTVLANLTTSDVADLELTVIRAIIPGLHPLFFGYRSRALGGCRLWEVPQGLSLGGIRPETGDNPLPHPFPRKGVMS
ncbi:MAG: YcaO-like family protein [Acidobacteriaceae bacterium]|nr:YcaO-like family protein [Acidobacteriaceae bacterium]